MFFQLKSMAFEIGKEAVIKIASSQEPLQKLIQEVGKINSSKITIQLFDPDRIINRLHLFASYVNAVEAFKNKSNISRNLYMEMLLFAAMTSQINEAIEKVGAKSNNRFIVFANDKSAYKKIAPLINQIGDFKPGKKDELIVAKQFDIRSKDNLDQFMLQKIAVSRLGD